MNSEFALPVNCTTVCAVTYHLNFRVRTHYSILFQICPFREQTFNDLYIKATSPFVFPDPQRVL